jgi:hypothetical protein
VRETIWDHAAGFRSSEPRQVVWPHLSSPISAPVSEPKQGVGPHVLVVAILDTGVLSASSRKFVKSSFTSPVVRALTCGGWLSANLHGAEPLYRQDAPVLRMAPAVNDSSRQWQ